MIANSEGDGEQLSPAALDEIRDQWNSGLPLRALASRWNVSVESLQRRIEARQRGRLPGFK